MRAGHEASDRRQPAVDSVFVKPERGALMQPCPAGARLTRRLGLHGDCHAQPLGPRQVLLLEQEVLDEVSLAHDALRGNVVTRGFGLEALPSGTVLALGSTARVRLTHRCEVCARIGQLVGMRNLKLLSGRRGYLGVVTHGGWIGPGDPIHVAPERYAAVPDHVLIRLLWVMRQIPAGRTLPYDLLVQLVGAPRGYLRALPRAVRTAAERDLPAHRVVTSRGHLLEFLSSQARLLMAEGVRCDAGAVDLAASCWTPRDLYFRRSEARPGQLSFEEIGVAA